MSLAFCFSSLFCQGTKLVVRMPRPWNLDPTFKAVEAAIPSAEGYSFPSIHSQSIVSVLGSIVYLSRHILVKVIMTILIVLVMFSRCVRSLIVYRRHLRHHLDALELAQAFLRRAEYAEVLHAGICRRASLPDRGPSGQRDR